MIQVSESFTPEEEIILPILKITNHPLFNISEGPIGGYDVSSYLVNDTALRGAGVGRLVPACLPSVAHRGNRAIFAGQEDQLNPVE